MGRPPAVSDVERDLATAEKKAEVVRLKRQHLPHREIAEQLGISESYSARLYREVMLEVPAADVAVHREEELELVLDALADLVKIVKDGSESARTRVEASVAMLRWSEHRTRILGLAAPTRAVQLVINEDVVDREMRKLHAEIEAAGGALPSGSS